MPNSPTAILGLTVPTVGGDSGVWGDELNTDLGIIDLLGAFGVSSSSISHSLTYGTFPVTVVLETGGVGGITVTLPTAVGHAGRGFLIKKVDAGVGPITIATISAQTIDGLATYQLVNRWQNVLMVSDNANWQIIANN